MNPHLGTCYYPEHWPRDQWRDDAQRMRDMGLSIVRIGEFAWSKLEPKPGEYSWGWLDEALEVLTGEGLQVVLGTPSATPPRWMLHRYPDMLADDENGHPRKFGSRRHYCFSHTGYRDESVEMAKLMAERYGRADGLLAWQIDNEYGCHDTVVSYSDAAQAAFRRWLANRYGTITALNEAWGNVFWSMEYAEFDDIDLPNLTVTEPNPAHCMDFRRFSSDQVVAFNRAQADAIRDYSAAPLLHNYMGRITHFDHHRVGEDLEIATWDSYPLGFLEDRSGANEARIMAYYRQGEPDFQAFHHDLYRSVGKGRWWIIEQQPGPVNWAPYNPAPLPGMVRLWTWEAIAHQAEAVCYFRWRQAPFAQEQMHAGLLRPDSQPAAASEEVTQVAKELADIEALEAGQAPVAMVFDYASVWAWEIQPQGASFDYFSLQLDIYRALRRAGLSVDILPADCKDWSGYSLVVVAALFTWTAEIQQALEAFKGQVLTGPRSGSKTESFSIPPTLPPNLQSADLRVTSVESLRPGASRSLRNGGNVLHWLEHIETSEEILEQTEGGNAVLIRKANLHYLAAWLDEDAMSRVLRRLCERAGIATVEMPTGLRQRCTASHRFLLNYGAQAVEFEGETIPPAGVKWTPL